MYVHFLSLTAIFLAESQGGWRLSQLQGREGRVHPWKSQQLIAGPYLGMWPFWYSRVPEQCSEGVLAPLLLPALPPSAIGVWTDADFCFSCILMPPCIFIFLRPPPTLSLAASGLQKQGDITNERKGGVERWTELKKGREVCNKVPLSAVNPVWALCSECVRTCTRWWAFAQSALTPFKVTASWASPPHPKLTTSVQQTYPSSAFFSLSCTVLWNSPSLTKSCRHTLCPSVLLPSLYPSIC